MNYEILAPAGDEQSAYAALNAGADAIYLGLTKFSAREGAENFDAAALRRVTRFAHLLGAKVYVALNTLVKDEEIEDFFASVRAAWEEGADAILLQDIFLGKLVKELYPEVVLHLSTQGGCCNIYGAQLAKDYGFSRVVLARETLLADIKEISKFMETEVFVQGALCTCFSGQCYMSSFAGNNSGNRGRCKQPCRKKYTLDRAGYTSPAYALSLSDLSAGKRMKEFLAAGVTSLKIEGRMRRPAYCAAAVKYCRAVLEGGDEQTALSGLKRTYNRGDYTRGLAFGQDKTFLSRKVQGHIGEEVGEVTLVRGKYFVKSDYAAKKGDGFKILRKGEEIGGGAFAEAGKGGFFLSSQSRLLAGDSVRLTTDAALESASFRKTRPISLKLRFFAGERAEIACGNFVYEGVEPLAEAKNAPLTAEELTTCFAKTDGMPFSPEIEVETAGAFLPKSALNALRREFYAALCEYLDSNRATMSAVPLPKTDMPPASQRLTATIAQGQTDADITIVKPQNFAELPAGGKGTYLYLPPLFTGEDEKLVAPHFKDYEGIYCEGYYGILLAKKYGIKLFAGTGFNLTNKYAVSGVKAAGAEYFALSKEISVHEQRALAAEGAFALATEGIKVMDLCYCPFEKTCSACDKREIYTLTDEEGRRFPMRRYRLNGCRFEVYNCALLKGEGGANPLYDHTVEKFDSPPTQGHAGRSML